MEDDPQQPNYATLSVRVRQDTMDAFRSLSAATGKPMSVLSRRAVDQLINTEAQTIVADVEAESRRREAAAYAVVQYVKSISNP